MNNQRILIVDDEEDDPIDKISTENSQDIGGTSSFHLLIS